MIKNNWESKLGSRKFILLDQFPLECPYFSFLSIVKFFIPFLSAPPQNKFRLAGYERVGNWNRTQDLSVML